MLKIEVKYNFIKENRNSNVGFTSEKKIGNKIKKKNHNRNLSNPSRINIDF